ncbi:unnamed protein product [Phytomonas sp. Hart1]|nr:unnamed protein product [Phytomonas sp. Hart1]|eukprot:CCW67796.1 unnamed protein product [Phytomonas sp. isolate Hart1]
MGIARTFFGYRREHGARTTQQAEVAAACFLLATELNDEPVPLPELRVLDPSLKNVEQSRGEVVADTKMAETEKRLRARFAGNLLRHYIRLLHLQTSRYEPVCQALLRVLTEAQRPLGELGQLTEVDRVFAAVLLARTEDGLKWEGKPLYDPARELAPATAYSSFAASAHLDEQRVHRVMQVVRRELEAIRARFAAIQASGKPFKAEKSESMEDTTAADGHSTQELFGLKRPRPS